MAKTRPRTLRIPPELEQELSKEFKARGQNFSTGVIELLTQAIKGRRVPGIYFRDTPSTRGEATIGGTGLGVWEVIALRQTLDSDDEIRLALPQLRPNQITAALAYYRTFPQEIDARIARDEEITPARVREMHPFLNVTETAVSKDEPANAA